MKNAAPPKSKKRFRVVPVVIAAVIAVVVLTAGGFAFAASQESHDPFCASCHTQPESTFVQRSTAAPSVDLASYHTTQNTLCIDCHSGQGILGRMQAELMGARNAVKWFTGTATQPAVVNYPVGDQNCLKCHQAVTQRGFTPKEPLTIPGAVAGVRQRAGRNNHWHEFLIRWQAADANAGTCITCHSGHSTDVNAQNGFINNQIVQATCDACHQAIRHED
jgi:nitrate/TMAO reductase-like tetraheme cytochrome c subunit